MQVQMLRLLDESALAPRKAHKAADTSAAFHRVLPVLLAMASSPERTVRAAAMDAVQALAAAAKPSSSHAEGTLTGMRSQICMHTAYAIAAAHDARRLKGPLELPRSGPSDAQQTHMESATTLCTWLGLQVAHMRRQPFSDWSFTSFLCGDAGAQLKELATALEAKRDVIKADQQALLVALQLTLQRAASSDAAINGRHAPNVSMSHDHWTFLCEGPVAHGCTKRRFAAKQFIENNQLRYSMQSAGLLRYPRLPLQHCWTTSLLSCHTSMGRLGRWPHACCWQAWRQQPSQQRS